MQNRLSSSLLYKNIKIKKIYTITVLLVVLYGCENWSLTMKGGRRLKTFENRLLRNIFVSKRLVIRGDGRKLKNGELNDP
jgi:hypothetical protein